jgi:hypothetical protein
MKRSTFHTSSSSSSFSASLENSSDQCGAFSASVIAMKGFGLWQIRGKLVQVIFQQLFQPWMATVQRT